MTIKQYREQLKEELYKDLIEITLMFMMSEIEHISKKDFDFVKDFKLKCFSILTKIQRTDYFNKYDKYKCSGDVPEKPGIYGKFVRNLDGEIIQIG